MRLWSERVEEMQDSDHVAALRRFAIVNLKVLFVTVTNRSMCNVTDKLIWT